MYKCTRNFDQSTKLKTGYRYEYQFWNHIHILKSKSTQMLRPQTILFLISGSVIMYILGLREFIQLQKIYVSVMYTKQHCHNPTILMLVEPSKKAKYWGVQFLCIFLSPLFSVLNLPCCKICLKDLALKIWLTNCSTCCCTPKPWF